MIRNILNETGMQEPLELDQYERFSLYFIVPTLQRGNATVGRSRVPVSSPCFGRSMGTIIRDKRGRIAAGMPLLQVEPP